MLKIKSCLVDNNARFEKTEVETAEGIVEFTQRPLTHGEDQISSDESRISETKVIRDENEPDNFDKARTEFFIRVQTEKLNTLRVLFSLGGYYNGKSHKIGGEGWTLKKNGKILDVNLDSLNQLHPQVMTELTKKAISLNKFDEAELKN